MNNLGAILFYLLILLSVFSSPNANAKSFPYEFSKKVDVPILSASAALALYSHIVMENNSEPTEKEINDLNKEDVNPLDRP